ncbi:MAG: PAS domain S-box protein [Chryseobacterium sp.]|nr:MAG: PAS domain S-box protein [Chryseobacterium sp.]
MASTVALPQNSTILRGSNLKIMLRDYKNELLDKIYQNLFDIVFVLDANHKILSVNKEIKTLGYTEEELELESIFRLANNNAELQQIFDNLSNGVQYTYRVCFVAKDKKTYWFRGFAVPIEINNTYFLLAVFNNIDSRVKTEQELKEHTQNIEKQLEEEKSYRLQQSKNSLQTVLARNILLLVGGSIFLPLVVNAFNPLPDSVNNSIFNIVLLLCSSISVIVGGIFNSKTKDEKDDIK